MPADSNTPEPLKSSYERMENRVDSFKDTIAFAAPELFDFHFGNLKMELAEVLSDMYTAMGGTPIFVSMPSPEEDWPKAVRLPEGAQRSDYKEYVQRADLVITHDEWVVKCRDGRANRLATDEEIESCVLLSEGQR